MFGFKLSYFYLLLMQSDLRGYRMQTELSPIHREGCSGNIVPDMQESIKSIKANYTASKGTAHSQGVFDP